MLKKIIAGFLILATTTLFGMSLSALNSASKAELMEINGIGEVKAAAIIKERRKGKFKSFEDVQRVEGICEKTADNIKRGVKSSDGVKKVKKTTKKKTAKKTKSTKKDAKAKTPKKRKIKTTDEKKKELKTKSKKTKTKKTKTKKTKAKKEKKTKSKKKN
ncbi:MAG: helix-hairpin-helix domain-containing protein [Epsilonproteobacteria bacterium]|nr:helix-hairpin-helix domain-containing protein [Campylobacterota bacterium]